MGAMGHFAVRSKDLDNDRFGSKAAQPAEATHLFMSAVPPIPTIDSNSSVPVTKSQLQTSRRSFDHLVGAQHGGYSSIPPLAVVFNLCDRRFDTPQGCMTWHP